MIRGRRVPPPTQWYGGRGGFQGSWVPPQVDGMEGSGGACGARAGRVGCHFGGMLGLIWSFWSKTGKWPQASRKDGLHELIFGGCLGSFARFGPNWANWTKERAAVKAVCQGEGPA